MYLKSFKLFQRGSFPSQSGFRFSGLTLDLEPCTVGLCVHLALQPLHMNESKKKKKKKTAQVSPWQPTNTPLYVSSSAKSAHAHSHQASNLGPVFCWLAFPCAAHSQVCLCSKPRVSPAPASYSNLAPTPSPDCLPSCTLPPTVPMPHSKQGFQDI